jgi:hypothetical protein
VRGDSGQRDGHLDAWEGNLENVPKRMCV